LGFETSENKLVQALEYSDKERREKRAERIRWISQFAIDGILLGKVEVMSLLSEARHTFIDGHYIATLLIATAGIEHIVSEILLQKVKCKERLTMDSALRIAEKNALFSAKLLADADRLRLLRNSFTHLKPDGHEHNLSNRFIEEHCHPQSILEEDARQSLVTMYAFLRVALDN
jgi:hypothetical protein